MSTEEQLFADSCMCTDEQCIPCHRIRDEIKRLRNYESLFTKYRDQWPSGCACRLEENEPPDPITEEWEENGVWAKAMCDFHKWHIDRARSAADATSTQSTGETK